MAKNRCLARHVGMTEQGNSYIICRCTALLMTIRITLGSLVLHFGVYLYVYVYEYVCVCAMDRVKQG